MGNGALLGTIDEAWIVDPQDKSKLQHVIDFLIVSWLVTHLNKLVYVEVDGFRDVLVVNEVARDSLLSGNHLCNRTHVHVLPLAFGLFGETNAVLLKEVNCLV